MGYHQPKGVYRTTNMTEKVLALTFAFHRCSSTESLANGHHNSAQGSGRRLRLRNNNPLPPTKPTHLTLRPLPHPIQAQLAARIMGTFRCNDRTVSAFPSCHGGPKRFSSLVSPKTSSSFSSCFKTPFMLRVLSQDFILLLAFLVFLLCFCFCFCFWYGWFSAL